MSIFLQYYGLREDPFGVTPDPRYLYLGDMHREALASLIYGLESGRGFLGMVAPPGMGKTTLLLHVLDRFQQSAQTAFLFQTQCNSIELLRFLMAEVDLQFEGKDLVSMLQDFNGMLIRGASSGRRLILVIDEAQNLDDGALETVRLLSNFESTRSKLLQIVLSGQEGLGTKLKSPAQMQLRQRLSMLVQLFALGPQQSSDYIDHRLAVAGYKGRELFTRGARDLIVQASSGIPRRINTICFGSLSLGCAVNSNIIDEAMVREVVSDLALDREDQSQATAASPSFMSEPIPSVTSPGPAPDSTPFWSPIASVSPAPREATPSEASTSNLRQRGPLPSAIGFTVTSERPSSQAVASADVQQAPVVPNITAEDIPTSFFARPRKVGSTGVANTPAASPLSDTEERRDMVWSLRTAFQNSGYGAEAPATATSRTRTARRARYQPSFGWALALIAPMVLVAMTFAGFGGYRTKLVSALASAASSIDSPRPQEAPITSPTTASVAESSTRRSRSAAPSAGPRATPARRPAKRASNGDGTAPLATYAADAGAQNPSSPNYIELGSFDNRVPAPSTNVVPSGTSISTAPAPSITPSATNTPSDTIRQGMSAPVGSAIVPALPSSSTLRVDPPQLLNGPAPIYPASATAKGISGKVLVDATIGADGRVHDAKIVSGPPELAQAAIGAVKQWVYKPSRVRGKAIESPLRLEFNFVAPASNTR